MVEIINDNNKFQFKTINYQFPHIDDKDYDGNWLMIRVTINMNGKTWTKTDPFLLTWELQEISEWFMTLSKNEKPKYSDLRFIEPNLRFVLKEQDPARIKVCLNAELIPDDWNRKDECYLEFDLDNKELEKISRGFHDELAKFPIRK